MKEQRSRISKCSYVLHAVFLMLMSSFLSFFVHSCRTSNRKSLMGNGQPTALPRPHSPLSAHAGDFCIYATIAIIKFLKSLYKERKKDKFPIPLLFFPLLVRTKSCISFHPSMCFVQIHKSYVMVRSSPEIPNMDHVTIFYFPALHSDIVMHFLSLSPCLPFLGLVQCDKDVEQLAHMVKVVELVSRVLHSTPSAFALQGLWCQAQCWKFVCFTYMAIN